MSDFEARYLALLRLLLAAGGRSLDLAAVLDSVCLAVGLDGCALVRAPFDAEPEALSGGPQAQTILREQASALWQSLTRDQVESAFLQLRIGGEPHSLFAYPLWAGEEMAGSVLGLVRGRRHLATEEDFLLALVTALAVARGGQAAPEAAHLREAIEQARRAAILETAIAVNHEVNNPLTAVLGNTQLLLLQAEGLDEKTKKRLLDIEKSALRIKEVTQKLLKNRPFATTEYPGGLRMLDLSSSSSDDEG